MKYFISFVLSAILLVGCGSPTTIPTPTLQICNAEEIHQFTDPMAVLWTKWGDQYKAAIAASKTTLPDQIGKLQEIKSEVENLKPTECTVKLFDLTKQYMKVTIDALNAFMGNEATKTVPDLLNQGSALMAQMNSEITRLADCLPYHCTP